MLIQVRSILVIILLEDEREFFCNESNRVQRGLSCVTRTSCFLMVYVCCELEQYVVLQYYWCVHILILNNTNSKQLEIKSNKDG